MSGPLQSGKTTVLYSGSNTFFDIPTDGTITAYREVPNLSYPERREGT
jgi:hypothetical protein